MPSEKILAMKQEEVQTLADEMRDAQTIVLANYRGITVAQDTELRAELRDSGVTYKVIKNSISRHVMDEIGLPELKEYLVGPTAIAYSAEDPVAPAKVLKKFSKEVPVLEIKGGASDGEVVEMAYLDKLASIPDLPVLYAKLVGSLVSPISGLAMLLQAIADKMEEAGAETAAEVYEGPKADAEDESAEDESAEDEATEDESADAETATDDVEETAADTEDESAEDSTANDEDVNEAEEAKAKASEESDDAEDAEDKEEAETEAEASEE